MNSPKILIVEDDPDQMDLLINFALSEIKKMMENKNYNDEQLDTIKSTQIIKVSNIETLQKAVSVNQEVLLALLDCNIPDTKDDAPNDQLIKTNHVITGQHRAVDIVTEYLPKTPITITSSMNRFQKIVRQHYETKHELNINFIPKNDQSMIQRNIGYYLRHYIRNLWVNRQFWLFKLEFC